MASEASSLFNTLRTLEEAVQAHEAATAGLRMQVEILEAENSRLRASVGDRVLLSAETKTLSTDVPCPADHRITCERGLLHFALMNAEIRNELTQLLSAASHQLEVMRNRDTLICSHCGGMKDKNFETQIAYKWKELIEAFPILNRARQSQTPLEKSTLDAVFKILLSNRPITECQQDPEICLALGSIEEESKLEIDIEQTETENSIEAFEKWISTVVDGQDYPFDLEDTKSNILFVEPEMEDREDSNVLGAATLRKLIERLTPHDYSTDLNMRFWFLLTHRYFATSSELFDALVRRFFVPLPSNLSPIEREVFNKSKRAPIQIKVFSVLKSWLEEHFDDFDTNPLLKARLEYFIQFCNDPERSARYTARTIRKFAAPLTQLLDDRQTSKRWGTQEERFHQSNIGSNLRAPKTIIPQGGLTLVMLYTVDSGSLTGFYLLSEIEIARQMTLIDFSIFCKIKPREWLNQAWTKADKETQAPNIFAMVQRFNHLSRWVSSEIVRTEHIRDRIIVVKKFLKIAECLWQINNLHACFALFCALNSMPVYRLRRTWEGVGTKYIALYESLKSLLKQDRNMKNLRDLLRQIVPPCIPHIGIFLTDLTFLDDGNDTFLTSIPNENSDNQDEDTSTEPCEVQEPMINVWKLRKVAGVVAKVRQFQECSYNFTPVPALQDYLQTLPNQLSDKEMLAESKKNEPSQSKN